MKKLWKRCIAYFIDMMVVMLIVQCISGISFVNIQLDDYHKYYQEYTNIVMSYSEFKSNFRDDYHDKKITQEEYDRLIEENDKYKELLEENFEDKEISSSEYDQIMKNVDDDYLDDYERVYYLIEKNSVVYLAVNLIVLVAYFVGFNMITDGQTLGKKLLRLKIVSSNKEKEKVSVWSYVVRMILLYQPLYYLIRLIGIFFLGQGEYYSVISVFYDIQYYLEFVILLTVMIRLDGRGIHDLLAKTRVILYDRDGNEIMDKYDTFLSKRLDTKKKKVIEGEVE